MRQVHRAGRERRPVGHLLLGRACQPQEAVGFGLEGRDRHGPEPRPAPQAFAALGRVDKGRPRHRARAVEPLDALDRRHLREALRPRPGIDRRGLVAGVDGEPRDPEMRAAFMRPGPVQQRGQLRPGVVPVGPALDDDVIDEPAFQAATPGPDIDLDPVLLHVGSGCQEQPACWHRAGFPAFAPVVEPLPVGRFPGLDPCLAEDRVAERLDRLVRPLGCFP